MCQRGNQFLIFKIKTMQVKVILKNIIQADKRGSLMLTSETKQGEQPSMSVAIAFNDPKKVKEFEQGETYEIVIKKISK